MSSENSIINDIFLEEGESKSDDEEESLNQIILPAESDTSLLGRVRRRQELEQPPNKIFRSNSGKRIIRHRTSLYSSLILKSGEEFHFTEEDGKKILLNELIEPNRLIRNIISKIPQRLIDRLEYLAKFDSEEESDASDEDENIKKVQKRYFGNLKELVYKSYIKEWRLRFLFKRLLVLWRINKMNKVYEKEIDPITLSEPEKEVYVYDWENRRKFIFDAKSLATLIESKLTYQEYGFPVPMYPRNPKNNVEFTYAQLISIYYQLQKQGEIRWAFTTLREFNFNKHRWHMYHKSALTMNAIKVSITLLDTTEARDLFIDFIFAKMEDLDITYTENLVNIYKVAIVRLPSHWYLEKLKCLAISHYEAEHFNQNRTRNINGACMKIFKRQGKFFQDLKNKQIIQ